jgi:hypothetical protein
MNGEGEIVMKMASLSNYMLSVRRARLICDLNSFPELEQFRAGAMLSRKTSLFHEHEGRLYDA